MAGAATWRRRLYRPNRRPAPPAYGGQRIGSSATATPLNIVFWILSVIFIPTFWSF